MKKRDKLDYLKHIKKEDYLIMDKGEEVVYKGFRNNDLKLREDLYGDSKEFQEKEKCDLLKAEPFEHDNMTIEEFSYMLWKEFDEILENAIKEFNEKFEKEIMDMLELIDIPNIEHIEFAIKEIFEDHYEYCRFVSVREETHFKYDKTYQYIITAFSEEDRKLFEISLIEIK